MHEEPKCSNESCRCSVPKDRLAQGDPFCSEYCAQHAEAHGRPVRACGCKHPECDGGD
jgi:hypothetical protein